MIIIKKVFINFIQNKNLHLTSVVINSLVFPIMEHDESPTLAQYNNLLLIKTTVAVLPTSVAFIFSISLY